MSNRLGAALTAGIIGLGALGVWFAPLATADVISDDSPAFDCRYMGNHICGPGNDQGVQPGWYGDMDCWPGAIYCPDIDGPYDPAKVHPGMFKPHSFDNDGNDLGPAFDGRWGGYLVRVSGDSSDNEDWPYGEDVGRGHGGSGKRHQGEDKELNHRGVRT